MSMNNLFVHAINDFKKARQKAAMQGILARITGKPTELLSYEEVRQQLRAIEGSKTVLRDIPLDAIVGSVGRSKDFTRNFLPLTDSDQDRWARVMAGTASLSGLPPIEVYQIGEVFFVFDGNHRVSVARELEANSIQAYVREVRTRVNITPDIQPDDLITKAVDQSGKAFCVSVYGNNPGACGHKKSCDRAADRTTGAGNQRPFVLESGDCGQVRPIRYALTSLIRFRHIFASPIFRCPDNDA